MVIYVLFKILKYMYNKIYIFFNLKDIGYVHTYAFFAFSICQTHTKYMSERERILAFSK